MKKTLPIILVVRDRLSLTQQTIATLFKNTTLPFRLIIISDASTDETNTHLTTLSDRARIYMMPGQKGPGACRNAGAAIAYDYDFLYFTDNDVYFLPGWLEKLYSIMDTYPNVGICGGYTTDYHKTLGTDNKDGVEVKYTDGQAGHSILIRKELWLRAGPFAHSNKLGVDDCALSTFVKFLKYDIAQPKKPCIVHCGMTNSFGDKIFTYDSEIKQKFPEDALVI